MTEFFTKSPLIEPDILFHLRYIPENSSKTTFPMLQSEIVPPGKLAHSARADSIEDAEQILLDNARMENSLNNAMNIRDIINLVENKQPKILYHGTIINHLDSIKAHGLEPSSGDLVTTMYGEYEDDGIEVPPLVYARDKTGLRTCVVAMGWLIRKHFNFPPDEAYSAEAIGSYGALCVLRDISSFRYRPEEDDGDNGEHPVSAEPGDYYSDYSVTVDKILVGRKLVDFLTKHGAMRP